MSVKVYVYECPECHKHFEMYHGPSATCTVNHVNECCHLYETEAAPPSPEDC